MSPGVAIPWPAAPPIPMARSTLRTAHLLSERTINSGGGPRRAPIRREPGPGTEPAPKRHHAEEGVRRQQLPRDSPANPAPNTGPGQGGGPGWALIWSSVEPSGRGRDVEHRGHLTFGTGAGRHGREHGEKNEERYEELHDSRSACRPTMSASAGVAIPAFQVGSRTSSRLPDGSRKYSSRPVKKPCSR